MTAAEARDSLSRFATARAKVSNALDKCGIGHDFDTRTSEQAQVIAQFFAKAQAYAHGQAVYNMVTNVPCGVLRRHEATADHAIKVGVIRALGELLDWEPDNAIIFAADILDDVNAHDEAARVREMLTSK